MKYSLTRLAIGATISLATLTCFAAPGQSNDAGQNADAHFYVGVNGNYTHADWKTMIYSRSSYEPTYSAWKKGTGGFEFGAYAGYMIAPHIGFEAGWNHLPTVNVTINMKADPSAGTPASTTPIKISGNMFYAAFMLTQNLPTNGLSVFAKVGPGYQKVNIDKKNDVLASANSFGLYAAAGLTYAVSHNLGVSVSAAGLSGRTNHAKHEYTNNPYIYSVSLAYMF